MANVVEVKVSGLDKIEEALEHAPLRVAKKILRNALVAGGRIWKQEIAARVRRGPHHPPGGGKVEYDILASHVGLSTSVKGDFEGSVRVGFSSKLFWAKFLERGTGPRRRKASRGKTASANQMPAFPFVEQAGSAKSGEVLDRFTEGVEQALKEEFRS